MKVQFAFCDLVYLVSAILGYTENQQAAVVVRSRAARGRQLDEFPAQGNQFQDILIIKRHNMLNFAKNVPPLSSVAIHTKKI